MQQRLAVATAIKLEVKTTDGHGRSVAEVFSKAKMNQALVKDGQAFVVRQYLGGCDACQYLAAEGRASRARLEVWQVEGGITRPWDFRRGRRGIAHGKAKADQVTTALQHHDDLKATQKPVQSEQAGTRWGLIPKRLCCFRWCSSDEA